MNISNDNRKSESSAGFTASRGSDARLTMASMMALLSTLPPPPKWHACTAKPKHVRRLRAECQDASPSPMPLGDTFAGIRLYEKPGQVADAWLFSDDKILRKYLNDELSELDLMGMIASGACHPNEKAETRREKNDDSKREATEPLSQAAGYASCPVEQIFREVVLMTPAPPKDEDPYQSEEYQKFVESMVQYCHCQPACNRPCDGVLAGGFCDGMDWRRDYDCEDA